MLCLFSAIYIYDPLQIFHKTLRSKARIHYNMRQQAAGVINNYEFDSVILGTSMLENTSAKEASKIFGGEFVNISMSGSDLYERKHVVQYMLSKKEVKNIIYSMDDNFLVARKGHPVYQAASYFYLYDKNPLNDFKVYLNTMFAKCALKELIGHPGVDDCAGKTRSLDRPNSWHEEPFHAKRFGGLNNWFMGTNSIEMLKTLNKIARMETTNTIDDGFTFQEQWPSFDKVKNYLAENVIELAKSHPNTNFYFVFPPYSRAKYSIWLRNEKDKFDLYQKSLSYLANQTEDLKNAFVYGYDDKAFLDDIANYKDLNHYHHRYNSLILNWMNRSEGLLLSNNVDSYIERIKAKALKYDLDGFLKTIKKYLELNSITQN